MLSNPFDITSLRYVVSFSFHRIVCRNGFAIHFYFAYFHAVFGDSFFFLFQYGISN